MEHRLYMSLVFADTCRCATIGESVPVTLDIVAPHVNHRPSSVEDGSPVHREASRPPAGPSAIQKRTLSASGSWMSQSLDTRWSLPSMTRPMGLPAVLRVQPTTSSSLTGWAGMQRPSTSSASLRTLAPSSPPPLRPGWCSQGAPGDTLPAVWESKSHTPSSI